MYGMTPMGVFFTAIFPLVINGQALCQQPHKDKRSGETMKDILLKLMLADLESGDILNTGGSRRYNILGNTDCPTPEEGGYHDRL